MAYFYGMKRGLFIISGSILIFSSCGTAKKVVKKEVTLAPVVVSAKNSEYRAAATRVWDIVNTRVVMRFNWNEKTANGQAWIDIHPYFYASDSLVLDAKSMEIDTVLLEKNNKQVPISYSYSDDELRIYTGKTETRDTVQLYIQYKAMPYANKTGGSSAITDDRGLYFINTDHAIKGKPMQIWTQGETESNSHWVPTIDKPNERFTTRIELLAPDSMQTLSNGYWAGSVKEGNHIRRDIWVMDKPIQTYAMMFAIGRFDITKDTWRGREVSYYTEPEFSPQAKRIFNYTPEMIEHFSTITGVNYPWNKYSQIVVRDYVSGAMENTSATLFGEFMNQTRRELLDRDFEDVVSHELFHQWFGDYVTCESWSNITLNESFANYGEQLWRKYKHGVASAERLAYDDLMSYIQSAGRGADSPLVRYYYNDREDVFDRISYEKGGAILRYMNAIMGDSAFYKAMNIYLSKNALHAAEVANWRQAVEEATGQDWNWFFNEWYFHGDHPVLSISYDYNDSAAQLTVHVNQDQADSSGYVYDLPLKALLINGDGNKVVDWDISHKQEVFTYPYKNGIKPVIVPDEGRLMPGAIFDMKKPWAFLSQFVHATGYTSKRIAITLSQVYASDSSSQEVIRLALNDTTPGIKEHCLSVLRAEKDSKRQQKFEPQVSLLAFTDSKNAVRAAAFDVLGAWKIKTDRQQLLDAIHDSSYAVAGSALNALFAVDSEKAYSIARTFFDTKPKSTLQSSMWTIIGKVAKEEDVNLFEQHSVLAYGTGKFILANGLYYYLVRVKSDIAFEKGVNVLTGMAMNDGIKSYRLGLGTWLFTLKDVYADDQKASKEKMATNTKRRAILQNYIDKMMAAETDEGNLKRYKELGQIN